MNTCVIQQMNKKAIEPFYKAILHSAKQNTLDWSERHAACACHAKMQSCLRTKSGLFISKDVICALNLIKQLKDE